MDISFALCLNSFFFFMKSKASTKSTEEKEQKKENILLNLILNIIIPTIILKYGGKKLSIGPELNLVIALSFPVIYGIYDFFTRSKINFISVLGFVSILLTGGIGLLKLPVEFIAYKEAAIPFIIGTVFFFSASSKNPLVRLFIYNPQIMDVDKIDKILERKDGKDAFEKLMRVCTWILAGSFFFSAVLNFALAKFIVTSATGTPEFNDELGTMNLLSWPVIVVPCMAMTFWALFKLVNGITSLTGLKFEEVFAIEQPQPKARKK